MRRAPETRPLEVPPDLDLPRRPPARMAAAGIRTAAARAAAPARRRWRHRIGATPGFTVAGTRDAVFAKVGEALGGIEGVTIASRAAAAGHATTSTTGRNFLVRVSAVEAGAYVSAVDPRGMPATGDAPARLIAALKAALGAD